MMKKLLIAPIAALLCWAGTANAAPLHTLTLSQAPQATQSGDLKDVFGIETHRSPAALIAQDAVYGGIAGLAIGAGVALLENNGNWGRDLAIGAGAGLLVGGVFGAVDAMSNSDRVATVDGLHRDSGFARGYGLGSKF